MHMSEKKMDMGGDEDWGSKPWAARASPEAAALSAAVGSEDAQVLGDGLQIFHAAGKE